jgi:hypothetical protein
MRNMQADCEPLSLTQAAEHRLSSRAKTNIIYFSRVEFLNYAPAVLPSSARRQFVDNVVRDPSYKS